MSTEVDIKQLAIVRERQSGATFFRLFAGLALIGLVDAA